VIEYEIIESHLFTNWIVLLSIVFMVISRLSTSQSQ